MKLIFLFIGLLTVTQLFAAEQVVKEETTPPAAESALTIDQIEPVTTNKSNL